MRILVTGGAGFIGSNFVRRIVDGSLRGISSITVLDKLTYAGSLKNLSQVSEDSYEFIQGDICDIELTRKLCANHDAVINFAAESHVDRSINGSREFIQTNVVGTQTLLDSARAGNVGTFVQISTDEVYGSISEGSWNEDEKLLPNSPYSASKASADLLARSFHRTYGMDIRITRCSNNYGPYQFPEKIIPLFVTNLIEGLKVPVYGNGQNTRDWLHVDDHCRAVHEVLMRGKAGEIYNIGGGTELTNLQLTQQIMTLMHAPADSLEYVPDRLGHDQRYSVDATKLFRELGVTPQIDFDKGLRATVRWYQENESWWRPLKK